MARRTVRCRMGKVRRPTERVSRPSARLSVFSRVRGSPAASAAESLAAPTGSTADDLAPGARGGPHADAGEQSAAADRDQNVATSGRSSRISSPPSPVPPRRRGGRTAGHHQSLPPRRRLGPLFCSGERTRPAKMTSPPWRRTPSTLTAGVRFRHHDDGPKAEPLRDERHRLGVIAARVGDYAAGAAPLGQTGNGSVGAPDLEHADRLGSSRT